MNDELLDYAFLIKRNKSNNSLRVSPNALAAMTLMIALSKPDEKEIMTSLIERMIDLNDDTYNDTDKRTKELGAI